MPLAQRLASARSPHRVLFILLGLFALLFCAPAVLADDMPTNVDKKSHRWLKKQMPRALPKLIQTARGKLDRSHIFIVDELGNWGAGRGRGKHQGTDFVIDLPHKSKAQKLHVGALLDAKVVHLNKNWGAYGNTLFLYRDTSPKLVYIYAHLDEINVKIGQKVKVGDKIGVFGCTGNCRGLRGDHIRHQVHVEVYVMPEDFKADKIDWTYLPMGQLRKTALSDGGRPHGVDLSRYFGSFKIKYLDRNTLGDKYEKNRAKGGLDAVVKPKGKSKGKKKKQ